MAIANSIFFRSKSIPPTSWIQHSPRGGRCFRLIGSLWLHHGGNVSRLVQACRIHPLACKTFDYNCNCASETTKVSVKACVCNETRTTAQHDRTIHNSAKTYFAAQSPLFTSFRNALCASKNSFHPSFVNLNSIFHSFSFIVSTALLPGLYSMSSSLV